MTTSWKLFPIHSIAYSAFTEATVVSSAAWSGMNILPQDFSAEDFPACCTRATWLPLILVRCCWMSPQAWQAAGKYKLSTSRTPTGKAPEEQGLPLWSCCQRRETRQEIERLPWAIKSAGTPDTCLWRLSLEVPQNKGCLNSGSVLSNKIILHLQSSSSSQSAF